MIYYQYTRLNNNFLINYFFFSKRFMKTLAMRNKIIQIYSRDFRCIQRNQRIKSPDI